MYEILKDYGSILNIVAAVYSIVLAIIGIFIAVRQIKQKRKKRIVWSLVMLLFLLAPLFLTVSWIFSDYQQKTDLNRTKEEITKLNVEFKSLLYEYYVLVENSNNYQNIDFINVIYDRIHKLYQKSTNILIPSSNSPKNEYLLRIYLYELQSYLLILRGSLEHFNPNIDRQVVLSTASAANERLEKLYDSIENVKLLLKSSDDEKSLNRSSWINRNIDKWYYLEAWTIALKMLEGDSLTTPQHFKDTIAKVTSLTFFNKYKLIENRIFRELEAKHAKQPGDSSVRGFFNSFNHADPE